MHQEWSAMKQANEELTAQLQQVESKLQVAEERLQMYEHVISHVPDRRLWEQLQEKNDIIDRANK